MAPTAEVISSTNRNVKAITMLRWFVFSGANARYRKSSANSIPPMPPGNGIAFAVIAMGVMMKCCPNDGWLFVMANATEKIEPAKQTTQMLLSRKQNPMAGSLRR